MVSPIDCSGEMRRECGVTCIHDKQRKTFQWNISAPILKTYPICWSPLLESENLIMFKETVDQQTFYKHQFNSMFLSELSARASGQQTTSGIKWTTGSVLSGVTVKSSKDMWGL